jgi:hypothetical protein
MVADGAVVRSTSYEEARLPASWAFVHLKGDSME